MRLSSWRQAVVVIVHMTVTHSQRRVHKAITVMLPEQWLLCFQLDTFYATFERETPVLIVRMFQFAITFTRRNTHGLYIILDVFLS